MDTRSVSVFGLALAIALTGCIGGGDDQDIPLQDSATAAAISSESTNLSWEGFLVAGPADRFAHVQETEPLVEPVSKMGFVLDVPAGTTALTFRLTWPGSVEMMFVAHGPEEAGMPTYMTGPDPSGEICVRIPADGVLPGAWKVMAHAGADAVDLAFAIAVMAEGTAPIIIVDEPHGHPASESFMMQMDMREPLPCDGSM